MEVRLPRNATGTELVEALERVAKSLNLKFEPNVEYAYEPGSVHEVPRTFQPILTKPVTIRGVFFDGGFWKFAVHTISAKTSYEMIELSLFNGAVWKRSTQHLNSADRKQIHIFLQELYNALQTP